MSQWKHRSIYWEGSKIGNEKSFIYTINHFTCYLGTVSIILSTVGIETDSLIINSEKLIVKLKI